MISLLVFALLIFCQDPPASERSEKPQADPTQKAEAPARQSDKVQQGESEQPKAERKQRRGRSHGPEARTWWEGMSEEERDEARRKYRRYRDLSDEPKAELERRHEFIKRETEAMLNDMPAEEREALMKLDPEARNKKVRRLMRARLKDRMPPKGDHPGPGPGPPHGDFHGQSFEERLQGSKDVIDQSRRKRMDKEMARAVQDGWIGQRAAEFYRNMSPETVESELMRVRQWRVMDRLDRSKAWPELGIDPKGRERLQAMQPNDFFQFMKKHRPEKGFRRGFPVPGEHNKGEGFGERRREHAGERPSGPPGEQDGERRPRGGKRGDRDKQPKKSDR